MGRAFSPCSYADSYPGRCRISCFAGNPALAWAGIAARLRRLVLRRATGYCTSIVRLALMGPTSWAIFLRPCGTVQAKDSPHRFKSPECTTTVIVCSLGPERSQVEGSACYAFPQTNAQGGNFVLSLRLRESVRSRSLHFAPVRSG